MRLIVMIAVIALAFAVSAHAATVDFAWTANSEPDLAGYRLFQRTGPGSYDYDAPVWEGTGTTCTHSFTEVENQKYCYVLRAFDTSDNVSGDSNEVCWTAPDVTPPANPQGLVMEAIELAIRALEKLRDAVAMAQ